MPSTYTTNNGIEKPGSGEQSNTWGDTANENFDLLDQSLDGQEDVTLPSAGTSGAPNALLITDGTVSAGRNRFIKFVDAADLGADAFVQLAPNDAEKVMFVENALSGGRSLFLFQGTYDAGRDLELATGAVALVRFTGGGLTSTVEQINITEGGSDAFVLLSGAATVERFTQIGINAGSAYSLTMPASPEAGDWVSFVVISGNAVINNITVLGNGNTVNGDPSLVIDVNNAKVDLIYNATEWRVG